MSPLLPLLLCFAPLATLAQSLDLPLDWSSQIQFTHWYGGAPIYGWSILHTMASKKLRLEIAAVDGRTFTTLWNCSDPNGGVKYHYDPEIRECNTSFVEFCDYDLFLHWRRTTYSGESWVYEGRPAKMYTHRGRRRDGIEVLENAIVDSISNIPREMSLHQSTESSLSIIRLLNFTNAAPPAELFVPPSYCKPPPLSTTTRPSASTSRKEEADDETFKKAD